MLSEKELVDYFRKHNVSSIAQAYIREVIASEQITNQQYGVVNPGDSDLPFVIVTAANASTAGAFSTRGFTRKALRATQHPMYSNADLIKKFPKLDFSNSRITEDAMREDLVNSLVQRKTKLVVIDEMQNSGFVNGGIDKAAWFLDSLKCVAAEAKTNLLLIGT